MHFYTDAPGDQFERLSYQPGNSEDLDAATGGYEFIGGFADRTTGQAGASDTGSNVDYTQELVDNDRWMRFGFDTNQQATVDVPYWSDPTPAPATGVGLFGGQYMPGGVTKLFNFGFSDPSYDLLFLLAHLLGRMKTHYHLIRQHVLMIFSMLAIASSLIKTLSTTTLSLQLVLV